MPSNSGIGGAAGGGGFALVDLSTNVDGITGAGIAQIGGMVVSGIELSSNSTDANYTFRAGCEQDALKTVVNSTGGIVTLGTTVAGAASNRYFTVPRDFLAGARYLQMMSGTPSVPIAGSTGSFARIIFKSP